MGSEQGKDLIYQAFGTPTTFSKYSWYPQASGNSVLGFLGGQR